MPTFFVSGYIELFMISPRNLFLPMIFPLTKLFQLTYLTPSHTSVSYSMCGYSPAAGTSGRCRGRTPMTCCSRRARAACSLCETPPASRETTCSASGRTARSRTTSSTRLWMMIRWCDGVFENLCVSCKLMFVMSSGAAYLFF